MKQQLNRREFILASTAVAGLGFGIGSSASQTPGRRENDTAAAQPPAAAATAAPTFKTKPHKALIARPTEDDLKRIKEAAFEGVE